MSERPPERLLDRVIFWVLGAALFFSVAIIPSAQMAVFVDGWTVLWRTIVSTAIIYLLIWGASRMRQS